jgi:NADP-dependent 3-hydroxy acid dehydrogenase YdfG
MTDSPVGLITGGGSGIGAAAARLLLARGWRITVTGRGEERLAKFAGEVGQPDSLLTMAGNAADYGAVSGAVAATVGRFGRLDAVVANAGYATHESIVDGDPAGWRDMVLTNVLGPAYLIRAGVDELRRSGGRIVLVSSVAGAIYSPGNIYGATKWAVTGLAENTRRAVTADGIGVTLIAPGRTDTPFWDNREAAVPDGLLLSAEQVAASIVWALTQPSGVDINTVTVRPVGQPV